LAYELIGVKKIYTKTCHFSEEDPDFSQGLHAAHSPSQVVTVSMESLGRAVDRRDLRFSCKQKKRRRNSLFSPEELNQKRSFLLSELRCPQIFLWIYHQLHVTL